MRFARFLAFMAVAMALVSCSPNPKRILERGNKYYDNGKYREASLMYRQALRADPKSGEAYYRLGLTALKMQLVVDAINAFRRAVQLLPANSPEWTDANVKYAELMLTGAPSMRAGDQARTLDEVRSIKDQVLSKTPNSFAGQRLFAMLTLNDALMLQNKGKLEESKKKLEEVIGIYRKALTLKPGDSDVTVALGDSLVMNGETEEAERIYR